MDMVISQRKSRQLLIQALMDISYGMLQTDIIKPSGGSENSIIPINVSRETYKLFMIFFVRTSAISSSDFVVLNVFNIVSFINNFEMYDIENKC